MATSVVSVETQAASEPIGRDERKRERGFALLLVSGLTLFALAVGGYHPYAEDGGLYIAGVKRLLDPALYPHGTSFVLEPAHLSLFAPAVAAIARAMGMRGDAGLHSGLPILLLAVHLASVWMTLCAAWMLAGQCWAGREGGRAARSGAVVLLACWLGLPLAGTALLLMDPYLTARSFSTPCMVLALVGALDMTNGTSAEDARRRRGILLWADSIALALAMHPLMASYALGATLMLLCLRSSMRAVKVGGTAALGVAALALAVLLQAIARPESTDYMRVAMTRTYWFLAAWRWYELVGLAAPLAILAVFAWAGVARTHIARLRGVALDRETDQARRALARMAVAAGATASVVALLFARAGAATHLVARMQPLRIFQIVYLVMILMLGAKLGEWVLRRVVWRWAAAMLLLGGAMLGAARTAFPRSHHMETPWAESRNEWVQAFLWIRGNTPRDALFALDADYINAPGEDAQCFRAIAERSALPDYSKDGGEASIAPELSAAWMSGQAAQQSLSTPARTDRERLAMLRPLGVSWVVLQAGAVTDFDCPYENAAVRVCRLR